MNPPPPKKLLDQYRDQLRLKQYSQRTEKTYVHWVKAYIFYHNKRHPKEMGVIEITQFITHLVSEKKFQATPKIKPWALSCSSIAMFLKLNLTKNRSICSALKRPKACRWFCQRMKPNLSSQKWRAYIKSSPNSCMAAACESLKSCVCVSRI